MLCEGQHQLLRAVRLQGQGGSDGRLLPSKRRVQTKALSKPQPRLYRRGRLPAGFRPETSRRADAGLKPSNRASGRRRPRRWRGPRAAVARAPRARPAGGRQPLPFSGCLWRKDECTAWRASARRGAPGGGRQPPARGKTAGGGGKGPSCRKPVKRADAVEWMKAARQAVNRPKTGQTADKGAKAKYRSSTPHPLLPARPASEPAPVRTGPIPPSLRGLVNRATPSFHRSPRAVPDTQHVSRPAASARRVRATPIRIVHAHLARPCVTPCISSFHTF